MGRAPACASSSCSTRLIRVRVGVGVGVKVGVRVGVRVVGRGRGWGDKGVEGGAGTRVERSGGKLGEC